MDSRRNLSSCNDKARDEQDLGYQSLRVGYGCVPWPRMRCWGHMAAWLFCGYGALSCSPSFCKGIGNDPGFLLNMACVILGKIMPMSGVQSPAMVVGVLEPACNSSSLSPWPSGMQVQSMGAASARHVWKSGPKCLLKNKQKPTQNKKPREI